MKKRLLLCCLSVCCSLLNTGCRDDTSESRIYYLKDVVISSRSGADIGAYAIINGNGVSATVPYDVSAETKFKVDLIFSKDYGEISVTPDNGGVYDFSNPQQFSVEYPDGRSELYTVTMKYAEELAPAITRFERRFVTPEISYVNTSTGDRYMRYAENTDITAVKPWIQYNAPSVRQISPGSVVDFSNGPVEYVLRNGSVERTFMVTVSNYGYGKHMPVSNFTLANDNKRLERLTAPEGPIAFDNTGSFLYVANGGALHRYSCSGNSSQAPSVLTLPESFAVSHIESVYMTVNETLQWGLYGCDAIENGGIFRIYYWATATSAPKLAAEIDLTKEGATVDCFSWKVVNNRIFAYLVDTAPLSKAVPEEPKIYIIRDLAEFNTIRTYEKMDIAGAVELGFINAPHTMLSPIDNTNDFLLSNGATPSVYVEYSSAEAPLAAKVIFPVTSSLPATVMGIRTFSFVRGKYIAWVEFSKTNTENNSAFLSILDVSKDGFKAAINNIITWGNAHDYVRFRIPLGNAANPAMLGHVAIFPTGTRLRIAASVANNGICAFEWE